MKKINKAKESNFVKGIEESDQQTKALEILITLIMKKTKKIFEKLDLNELNEAEEIISKKFKVSRSGNSCHIPISKDYDGRFVKIVLLKKQLEEQKIPN